MNLKMDFVGRMENIQQDFTVVASRLGCQRLLGESNRSNHRDYAEYYSSETRGIVAAVYRGDVEQFGYTFN
jgi:hypothetical protein